MSYSATAAAAATAAAVAVAAEAVGVGGDGTFPSPASARREITASTREGGRRGGGKRVGRYATVNQHKNRISIGDTSKKVSESISKLGWESEQESCINRRHIEKGIGIKIGIHIEIIFNSNHDRDPYRF